MGVAAAKKYIPPRWDHAEDYPDTEDVGRLGAEFLRRNAQFKLATAEFDKVGGDRKDPNSLYRQKLLGVCLCFGIRVPLVSALPWGDKPTAYFERPPYLFNYPDGDIRNPMPSECITLTMVFDFRQSIDLQLARARKIFEAQRETNGLRPAAGFQRQRRDHSEFSLMLRILDARLAKQKYVVIAKTLFPKLDDASALAKIKGLNRQAESIRDGGYRYFALLAAPKKER